MSEITPYKPQSGAIIQSFDDAERAARAMAASGFFADSKGAAQALVKILAGQELGFGPFASMTGVSLIQGKPTIGANLMAAAVKRTGKYNYRVIEMSDNACELEFYEMGRPVGKSRFTMEDARAAGLADKDIWRKYRRNLMFARAMSNGVKWYTPDIFNGATVYTPEELDSPETFARQVPMDHVEGDELDDELDRDEPLESFAPTAPKAPVTPPAKPAQPTQKAAPTGNPASIKTAKFSAMAAEIAQNFPEYAKNGAPDLFHVCGAAGKCGFTEITDANLEAVKRAIIDRALSKRASADAVMSDMAGIDEQQ